MDVIEYKDLKINIPTGWHEVTLGDWDQLHTLPTATPRDRVAFVLRACKQDPDEWLKAPIEVFNAIVGAAKFLFEDPQTEPSPEITIDGQRFVIPIEDSLELGAWIDADEAQKENELVGVLATVCRPAGQAYDPKASDERRPLFAALPMTEAFKLLGFFLLCAEKSQRLTTMYSTLNRLAAKLPPSTSVFRNIGAGTKLLRIWPIMKYYVLKALLDYRLRRHLRLCGIANISDTQTPPKEN